MKESEALKTCINALIKGSDDKQLNVRTDAIDFIFEAYAYCKMKEEVRNV